jgi:hypothetical protein
MADDENGTHQKVLTINLHATTYGTIAEIGAGQGVARWFLQVGAPRPETGRRDCPANSRTVCAPSAKAAAASMLSPLVPGRACVRFSRFKVISRQLVATVLLAARDPQRSRRRRGELP